MKDECEEKLKELSGKKFIVFTKRGNVAILSSLKLMKSLGYSKVLIQDQGGWMTYSQFIKKLKLEEVQLKTDYGLFLEVNSTDGVLLFNSMPAYFALQFMTELYNEAKENKLFVINDVAGSIGTKEAKIGDLIIGSFGKWKPLNVEDGGFVATDNEEHYNFLKEFEHKIDFKKLYDKLSNLQYKLMRFEEFHNKVKNDLSGMDIIHREKKGINVIVRFSSDEEREKLIYYCDKNNYDYVECPKYIRVMDNAISIEVKRLDI